MSRIHPGAQKPSKTGSSTGDISSLKEMRDFQRLLGEVYPKLVDSVPDLVSFSSDPSKLKKALSSPIESLPPNASREAFGLAASLFLGRKVVPAPVGVDPIPDYISKMGRTQTPNVKFLAFCSKELERMFPKGWDSSYVRLCSMVSPSAGASSERGRKKGGARSELAAQVSRDQLVRACLTGEANIDPNRHVAVIDDNGKHRLITIASCWQQVLSPLHHLLYNHISKYDWLLKGDATPNSFKEFTRRRGEVFVSGDYESATDNFNNPHSQFILECILRSSSLPDDLCKLAIGSLTGTIEHDGVKYPQIAGQLMGNLLSFPLLCITNYLAFKYAIRRKVPLRINGDDIAFRASQEETARWMQTVADAGLTLSRGKTLVNERFFSLNSTFFEARGGRKPSLVPVIRAKSIYAPLAKRDPGALAARLHVSCKGYTGWRKGIVKGHILRWHAKAVRTVGCSLNRALGSLVTYPVLRQCALLEQEAYYVSLPPSLDKAPVVKSLDPKRLSPQAAKGWREIPKRLVSKSSRDGYHYMWARHCVCVAYTKEVNIPLETDGGDVYEFGRLRGSRLRRMARLAHNTVRGLGRLLSVAWSKGKPFRRWVHEQERVRRPRSGIWVPEGEVKYWTVRPTKFRSAGIV
jgi:hypothetical protein